MHAHAPCRPPAARHASRRSRRRRGAAPSTASTWTAWTAGATTFGLATLVVGALGPSMPAALGGALSDLASFALLGAGAAAIGLGAPREEADAHRR
jgi:hypothetical protein